MIPKILNEIDVNPDEAISLCNKVINSKSEEYTREDKLKAEYLHAKALTRIGDYKTSFHLFPQIIKGLHRLKMTVWELAALEEYAGVALLIDDSLSTAKSWVQCFLLAVSTSNIEFLIKSLCGIGKAFWNASDYEKAKSFHEKAYELALLYPKDHLLTYSVLCLVVDHIALKEEHEGLSLLESTKEIILSQSNSHWHCEFYLYYGVCSTKIGNTEKGESALLEAEKLSLSIKFYWLLVQVYIEKLRLKIEINDTHEILQVIGQALDSAGHADSMKYTEDIHLIASTYFEKAGDYKSSLYHFKKAQIFTEKLVSMHNISENKTFKRYIQRAYKKIDEARLQIINANMLESLDQNKDLIQKLETAASIDPLSQMYNRRALEEYFDNELTKEPSSLCVMIIDIDHFKTINDTFGHDTGDTVIKTMGSILNSNSRKESEFTARFGGEEFCLISHCSSVAESLKIAIRIHQAITDFPWHTILKDRQVTVSLGLAFGIGNNGRSFLKHADGALYKAKEEGRNTIRYTVAPEWKMKQLKKNYSIS